MKLKKNQIRFIKSKNIGFEILKGDSRTGKTVAAVNKAVLLKNEYCLFNDDKILYICSDEKSSRKVSDLYKRINENQEYLTLFSEINGGCNIISISEIIEMYAKSYIKGKRMSLQYASMEDRIKKLEEAVSDNILKYKKSKLLKKLPIDFIFDEVNWIKAAAFDEDEYLLVDRKGRGRRIKKNSESRRAIYNIAADYTESLAYDGLMDEYDYILYAIKSLKKYREGFTHIVVDQCEKMKKGELKFLSMLYNNKSYSSFICIVNTKDFTYKDAWLKKGVKLKSIFNSENKIKTFNFKNNVINEVSDNNFISRYEFVDLKHRRVIDFKKDTSSSDEEIIIFNKENDNDNIVYEREEQISVPVFSDIAAGEPILMNSEIESTFSFPNVCLKDKEGMFLLHVKGDSMKDAGILDGDFVLMKRQNAADHNDIVAADIDGSATLKRLKLYDEPVLMPENKKYKPISIKDKNINILGIAIGVLKRYVKN